MARETLLQSFSADQKAKKLNSLKHLPIRRQREQREVLPVHLVLEIEHARKARTSRIVFRPGAVCFLRLQQIGYAALDGFALGVAATTPSAAPDVDKPDIK